MREGWCSTCGAVLRVAYAAGREPRRMFCNNAYKYTEPRGFKVVETGDQCVVVLDSCRKRGTVPIGVGHGYSAYAGGCRCSLCTEANRLYCMRGRLSRYCDIASGVLNAEGGHGIGGYRHGCRCGECRAAKKAENTRRYQAT